MSGPVASRAVVSRDRVRAATLVAPGRYEIRDSPVPDPAPGCVVVRMALSGICGTDKHTYQG
jgi:L-iditol 2-dehydrogenase